VVVEPEDEDLVKFLRGISKSQRAKVAAICMALEQADPGDEEREEEPPTAPRHYRSSAIRWPRCVLSSARA
jgi:hypothetical protein